MRNIDFETKLGGIFGIIAFLAIVAEIYLGSFATDIIVGGIKDLAGTLVAIMVLVVAVKKIKPKKTDETFESVLAQELDDFERRSQPLIHRAKDFDQAIRYYLITRMDRILYATSDNLKEIKEKGSVNSGTFNGKFADLSIDDELKMSFYLNASTFKDRAKVEEKTNSEVLANLGPTISNCINKQSPGSYEATPSKDGTTITVCFKKKLAKENRQPEDAREIVKLINYVFTLYTIAS